MKRGSRPSKRKNSKVAATVKVDSMPSNVLGRPCVSEQRIERARYAVRSSIHRRESARLAELRGPAKKGPAPVVPVVTAVPLPAAAAPETRLKYPEAAAVPVPEAVAVHPLPLAANEFEYSEDEDDWIACTGGQAPRHGSRTLQEMQQAPRHIRSVHATVDYLLTTRDEDDAWLPRSCPKKLRRELGERKAARQQLYKELRNLKGSLSQIFPRYTIPPVHSSSYQTTTRPTEWTTSNQTTFEQHLYLYMSLLVIKLHSICFHIHYFE